MDRSGCRATVRVFGDLDWSTAGALSVCLSGLTEGGVDDVVLDLDGVPFCDSSGLGVLLRAHRMFDGHVEVSHAAPDVRHVLAERGLDRVLHVT